MTAGGNAKGLYPLLAASIAIGAIDNAAFFVFRMGILTDTGFHWMLAALLSWIALFCVAANRLGGRSLWLLLALPPVLLPFALVVIAAGQI